MAPPLWTDADELERRLRAVEPTVRVVPERHIRRVLHMLDDAGDERVINPALPVWVSAEFLRETEGINTAKLENATGELLLVSEPEDRHIVSRDDGGVLHHYWRLLFRAVVQREVAAHLGPDLMVRRFETLPPEFVEEVRFVLESDHVIRHKAPAADFDPVFAATCAELVVFEPDRLHDVYPSAPPAEVIKLILGPEPNLDALAQRLRPEGASDHPHKSAEVLEPAIALLEPPLDTVEESDRLARLGNYSRAAVKRWRAAQAATSEERQRLEEAARAAIRNGLVKGLARVLNLNKAQSDEWFWAVWPLVGPAAAGGWPYAARALYDLQKLAADLNGRLFAVDPVEWIRSFFRKPLRRPLDRARDVMLHVRLARIEKHVVRARLSPSDRDRLLGLLHEEMAVVEARIRTNLGPIIRDVFDRIGLIPHTLPERVACDKLVAELLDRICERGFLRISDLRDAIARNQLKLPDLSGLGEFFRGDPLLRIDALLGNELYGVYHRGEIYLRWIQRFSSLAFGTRLGRFVTRFIAMPFGGAFLGLEFLQHVIHGAQSAWEFVEKLVVPETPEFDVDAAAGAVQHITAPPHPDAAHGVELVGWESVLGVGFLLFALIHSRMVRRFTVRVFKFVWRLLNALFVKLPRSVLRSAIVRAIRSSRPVRLFDKYFGPAALFTTMTVLVLLVAGAPKDRILRWGGGVFVVTAIVMNTPFGRRLRDSFEEALSDAWRTIRVNLIPGLIAWFLWIFRVFLGAIDRMLYAVDEKLRYREGASRPSVFLRAVFALIWFPIAYVIRFAFYLLLEPQVNPVKHFPVVTVSHKVMLPLIQPMSAAFNISIPTATAIISGIPGIFGFLVWELKENWRLYAANRSPNLRRVPIGHHGETGQGLLRPGFHSGTVPKLYRKLRAGWLDGDRPPPERTIKTQQDLHHIEIALRRLCEREVFPLWAAVQTTANLRPVVKEIHLGCQHFVLRIGLADEPVTPIIVTCWNGPNGIGGEVESWGWATQTSSEQQAVIRTGIEGLLALAAARRGREPIWSEWVEFWSKREAALSK